ncbi:MAG: membrane protein insertion efficiency factor YidD [Planctomycetes bacterium]|jgi:hypothetical protein|nr:membrane protein insertion efficiency factor YidD [Planctomycetota bacterium]MBT4028418.1 membrane protein insertion efficiency factor YidD [Planctomycetota bacterium]MBT4559711.1 membrane protein insertion efficiency factor YidD [Planctomycetota bacterium]MBT5100375.1 membrane protein insertion efficiency factor YidD [Planctomycetota bacterium]MBT7013002.1 membrane protein insertion efficiency factor YidD [Planctomycetota bacterium]
MIASLLALPVRFYQKFISPMLGGSKCRFTPTCSSYALEALKTRGAWVGFWLGLWRVLRCQPFCKGGYDPVPLHPSCLAKDDCECGESSADRKL